MKGIIALDIDGTVTAYHDRVPARTVARLHALSDEGWLIIFITGRPFQHVEQLFANFRFPYHVAPQNGALLVEMPSGQVVSKRCLSSSLIPALDRICTEEESSFVVYTGAHCQDRVYWCPERWPLHLREYLTRRQAAFREPWQAIDHFEQLPVTEFASMKSFGNHAQAHKLGAALERELGLHVPVIDDPFDAQTFVAQGTRADVTKGQALLDFAIRTGRTGPTIAAGDNANDYPLLAAATIRIAMANAPAALRAQAHIIAPPATEEGLLQGLDEACARCQDV